MAVLDKTKKPDARAEPFYLDMITTLAETFSNDKREALPRIIGRRYDLPSKKFGSGCVLAVFAEFNAARPKARSMVGIYGDMTDSLPPLPENTLSNSAKLEALFYGFNSDGSISTVKDSTKIIGDPTPWYAQGYFTYNSEKADGLMVSHPRVSE